MKRSRPECASAAVLYASLASVLFSSAVFLSCASPAAISEFAQTAGKALRGGPFLFRDIHESCVRRHRNAAPITPLFLRGRGAAGSEKEEESAVCVPFGPQGEALSTASDVLVSYFQAMQQLASFKASTVSSPSEKAAQDAGLTAKFTTIQADSVGKLAGLVTQLLTERYQRSKLLHLLREADPAIASVTQAFEDVVSKDYQGLLREEQQGLAARYQDAGEAGNLAIILLLNRSYTEDMKQLNRRKSAAEAYVRALQQIREGHHELAQNLPHLKAKDVSLALEPYTARLEGLVPALQQGF